VDENKENEGDMLYSARQKILVNPDDALVNEYPFVTEEFGKLQLNEKVVKGYLFNCLEALTYSQ